MANVAGEGFVQTAGFCLELTNFHVNACGAQLLKTLPAYLRIGIGHGGDHTADSGSDQGISTRGRPALMRMGFEIDVQRAAAGLAAGLLESLHFGVLHTIVSINTCACDVALCVDDNSTDVRIWRGQSSTLALEI